MKEFVVEEKWGGIMIPEGWAIDITSHIVLRDMWRD